MGVPAQLSARPGARRGIALPSALFALVAVMVLALGVVGLADARLRAAKDREASTRAVLLAEEGIAHGLTILKDSLKGTSMNRLLLGADNTAGTADDGVLAGYVIGTYTMSSAISIPTAGRVTPRGTYQVQMIDDPQDPAPGATVDGNLRIIMRCTATSTDGGTARIDALLAGRPSYGVVVDGDIRFSGNAAQVRGSCGDVHANGAVSQVNVTTGPRIAGLTSSSTVAGVWRDTLSNSLTPSAGQPVVPVATINLADLCSRARYLLRSDGYLEDRSTTPSIALLATATARNGWIRTTAPSSSTLGLWTATGPALVTGTYCVQGNVANSGNVGADGAPLRVSIIATGSIEITGTPYLQPASSDSVLFVAGGDIRMAGNTGSSPNYEGLVYAENHCHFSGNARLFGSVVCRNRPQTAGATEFNTTSGPSPTGPGSSISGGFQVSHSCNGWMNGTPYIKSWYQPAS